MDYDAGMEAGMDPGAFSDPEGTELEPPTGLGGSESSFLLVPVNDAAVAAVAEPANERFWYDMGDGRFALNIILSPDTGTISLGCGERAADIFLPDAKGAEMSRRHCKFTAGQPTGAVVLHDLSRKRNTEVYDRDYDRRIPISRASDSVVVSRGFNRSIALGEKKYYQFDLRWNTDMLNSWLAGGPRVTLGPWGSGESRYVKGVDIGAGAFGAVWRAVDIRTGKAIAVKRFHTMEGRRKEYADREVLNLFKIRDNKGKNKDKVQNDHILEIIDVEHDAQKTWMEMLMPLMEGSLKHLAQDDNEDMDLLGEQVLYQMLLALKCTASHDIVHRDLKPDNILYETRVDGDTSYYHFKLADFGLSHDSAQARTRVGTEPFMAPEAAKGTKFRQSVKMDLWSLFATIAWLWNYEDFRRQCWILQHPREIHDLLLRFANSRKFRNIRKMARLDPTQRPSPKKLIESHAYLPVRMDGEEDEAEGEDAGVEDLADDMGAMGIAEQPPQPGDSEEFRYEHYDVEGQGRSYNPAGPSNQNRQEEWPRYAGYGHDEQHFEEPPQEFGPLYDDRYAHGRMGLDYDNPSNYQEQAAGGHGQPDNTRHYASTKHRESKHKSKGKGKGRYP